MDNPSVPISFIEFLINNPGNANQVQTLTLIISISIYSLIIIVPKHVRC